MLSDIGSSLIIQRPPMGYLPPGYSPPRQKGGTFTVNPLGALCCSVIIGSSLIIQHPPMGYLPPGYSPPQQLGGTFTVLPFRCSLLTSDNRFHSHHSASTDGLPSSWLFSSSTVRWDKNSSMRGIKFMLKLLFKISISGCSPT